MSFVLSSSAFNAYKEAQQHLQNVRQQYIISLRDEEIIKLEKMIVAVRSGDCDEYLLGEVKVKVEDEDMSHVLGAGASDEVPPPHNYISQPVVNVAIDIDAKKHKYHGVKEVHYANRTVGYRVVIGTIKASEDGKIIKGSKIVKGRFATAEDAARAYDAAAREENANGSTRKYKFNFQ
jgi:hypothetical protein